MRRTTLVLLIALLIVGVPTASGAGDDRRPLNVGFLVLEGVYNSELVAPFDIFHHTIFHTDPGMRVFTVGRERGMERTFEGLKIVVEHSLEDAPPIDVLVVPSARHNMDTDLDDDRLIEWLKDRGRAADYVLSICDGAFLLAEAGLLDGRRCTTFPGDIEAFRKRFKRPIVVEGVRFVADGPAITGVGGALSYDPALFLVHHLYGEKVARGVARGMVLEGDPDKVRHLTLGDRYHRGRYPTCVLPGDTLEPDVAVEDAAGEPMLLADVVADHPDISAVVLTILGGAEARAVAGRGGLWCEDSFSEIANLRHLRLEYGRRGVLFVAVLCPPVHHEADYGYDTGAFLTRPEGDAVYRENRRRFVEASEMLLEQKQLPFDVVLYDPRFRLLAHGESDERISAITPRPSWQGRFRWFEDTQTYGTPTTWVLSVLKTDGIPRLVVPGPPFFMNVYESEGRKLRYTPGDIAILLDRVLGREETR